MTLLDHPIFKHLASYASVDEQRANVDFLQLPEQLRALALDVVVNCVSCGAVIHPLRARAQSERSRVGNSPTERRLFYAATCPSEVNAGCSRTHVAKQHKVAVLAALGFEDQLAVIETYDALCLQEPWLELILLGIKTLETRTKCLRRSSGEVVLTSSQTYDEEAWNNQYVGGLLSEAEAKRALEGLGKMRGLVYMGGFRPGIPVQEDAAACIKIDLGGGRVRQVSEVSQVRRLVEESVVRVQERDGKVQLVGGSSQGFFRILKSLVKVTS